MSALTARGKNVKYYICVAISLCFIFLFGKLVQPFAGITPVGISILGIFFGVLIATIVTGETFWPALLGLFGMIVCDFTTAGDLLKTWFGNTTIQQIIWVMALTGAVTESGAVNVLARKVLKIRALKGHPMRLITALFLTVLVCAALVSSPTTMLLLWYPILDGICEMCGVEKNSDLKRELLLGIYIAAMGAYVLPFKGVHLSSIAIISGIMESSGLPFNNMAYLVVATLVVLAFVLVYTLFIRFVWKTDLTPLKEFDVDKMGLTEADLKMTGKQKTLFGFMLFGIVFLLLGMALTGQWNWSYLPLHLCSINVFVCLYNTLTDQNWCKEELYALCIPGAALALLCPSWLDVPSWWTLINLHSISIHALLVLYPVLLVVRGYRPSARRAPQVLAFLFGSALPIYFLNKPLNTNFYFLNNPYGNVITSAFTRLLGEKYYILGFLPAIAVALCLMYLPWVVADARHKKRK